MATVRHLGLFPFCIPTEVGGKKIEVWDGSTTFEESFEGNGATNIVHVQCSNSSSELTPVVGPGTRFAKITREQAVFMYWRVNTWTFFGNVSFGARQISDGDYIGRQIQMTASQLWRQGTKAIPAPKETELACGRAGGRWADGGPLMLVVAGLDDVFDIEGDLVSQNFVVKDGLGTATLGGGGFRNNFDFNGEQGFLQVDNFDIEWAFVNGNLFYAVEGDDEHVYFSLGSTLQFFSYYWQFTSSDIFLYSGGTPTVSRGLRFIPTIFNAGFNNLQNFSTRVSGSETDSNNVTVARYETIGPFGVRLFDQLISVPVIAVARGQQAEEVNFDETTVFSSNGLTVVPDSYWPYNPNDGLGPIYDSTTGDQLRAFPS